jgi:hypothetical protein
LGTESASGDHRAVLARALAAAVSGSLEAGDAEAARLALGALQKLVGDAGDGTAAALVVDLAAARRRRR